MANIVCPGCGNTYDSLDKACSRCHRCPECGSKVRDADNCCPSCGHPADADSLRKLEEACDPAKPENAKYARAFQRELENEQVWKRVRWWRLIPFGIVGGALSAGVGVLVGEVFGLSERWQKPVMMIFEAVYIHNMINLIALGYFPWLLREPKQGEGEG